MCRLCYPVRSLVTRRLLLAKQRRDDRWSRCLTRCCYRSLLPWYTCLLPHSNVMADRRCSRLLTILPPKPRPALIQRATPCQLYVFTIVSAGFICAPKPPFLTSPEGPPWNILYNFWQRDNFRNNPTQWFRRLAVNTAAVEILISED